MSEVPVRQWVLSTPFEIRLLLARNANAFGELTRLFMEEVLGRYRRRAAKLGISSNEGSTLVFQHRFGGLPNLNTHRHAVLVDGVFEKEVASDGTERVKLHALPPEHPAELTAVAFDVCRKFVTWIKKKGLMRLADANDADANDDPLAAVLRGSLGIGQVVELDVANDVQSSQGQADDKRFALRKSPHIGEFGGFSIHAGVAVHAADKDGRERLIRYCARPAPSMERMSETRDGLIAYRLRHAQKGKATHRVMQPVDFLARIAAVIPPPRHPLIRYFGVFGPHSSLRKLCVPDVDDASQAEPTTSTSHATGSTPTASDPEGTQALPPDPPAHGAATKLTAGITLCPTRRWLPAVS